MAYESVDLPSPNEDPNLNKTEDPHTDIQLMNELCQVMGDEMPVLCSSEQADPVSELLGVSINDPTEMEHLALCLCQKCSEYFTSDKELNSHNCDNELRNNISLTFNEGLADGGMKENDENITDHIQDLLKGIPPKNVTDKTKPASNASQKQIKKPDRPIKKEKPKKVDDRPKTADSRSRNDGGPHACHMCDKKFSRRSSLSVHIRRHTGETPYECEFCKRKFVVLYDLDRHMLTHLGSKKYTCFCDVCRKPFVSKSGMLQHKKIFHVEMTLYPCGVCGMNFVKQALLDEHMETHEDEIIIEYYDTNPPSLLIVYENA